MTRVIFSGVEVGSNRTLLEGQKVELMGLNFWGLKKRGLPKTKLWLISEHFNDDTKVIIESGATQADAAGLSRQELMDFAAEYQEFVANNADRATMFDVRHLLMKGEKELAIQAYCKIFQTTSAKARKDVEDLERSLKV